MAKKMEFDCSLPKQPRRRRAPPAGQETHYPLESKDGPHLRIHENHGTDPRENSGQNALLQFGSHFAVLEDYWK